MQCTLFSRQTLNFKPYFEFESKDKYEIKMIKRLKKNFKRKIYINSFCLISQVSFFFGAVSNFAITMVYNVQAKLVPLPHELRERG